MIELPRFGQPWDSIVNAVVWAGSGGGGWPEGNEDQLWELEAHYTNLSARLAEAMAEASAAADGVAVAWGGAAGAQFGEVWDQLGVAVPKELLPVLDKVAEAVGQMALELQYSKLEIIVEICVLLVEIFVMLVLAWLSFGAALAASAARIGVSRFAVANIFEVFATRVGGLFGRHALQSLPRLMLAAGKRLPLAMVLEGNNELGITLTTQFWQKQLGTRDEFNTRRMWASWWAGGMAALVSGPLLLGEFGTNLIKNALVRNFGRLGMEVIQEIAEEAVASFVAQGIEYGTWEWRIPTTSETLAGMVRNTISGRADLGGLAWSGFQALAGLENAQQRAAEFTRLGAETAALMAQDHAAQARAAADVAQRQADAATAAHGAAQLAASTVQADPLASPTDIEAVQAQVATTQAAALAAQQSAAVAARAAQTAVTAAAEAQRYSGLMDQMPNAEESFRTLHEAELAQATAAEHALQAQQAAGLVPPAADTGTEAAAQPGTAPTAGQAPGAPGQPGLDTLPAEQTPPAGQTSPAGQALPGAGQAPPAGAPVAAEPGAPAGPVAATPSGTPVLGPPAADAPSRRSQSRSGPATGQQDTAAPDAAPAEAAPPQTPAGRESGPQEQVPVPAAPAAADAQPDPKGAAPASAPTPDSALTPDSVPALDAAPTPDSAPGTAPDSTPAAASVPAAVSTQAGASAPARDAATSPAAPQARPEDVFRRDLPQRPASQLQLGGGVWAGSPQVRQDSMDPPSPAAQRTLDLVIPRDGDLLPQIHPHPLRSPWQAALNGGGALEPGRSNNCGDELHAELSTWYGVPTVAGVNRTGEAMQTSVTENWTGGRFTGMLADEASMTWVATVLDVLGHGASVAIVYTHTPDSPVGHAVVGHHHAGGEHLPGGLFWRSMGDAQSSTTPPDTAPMLFMQVMFLDANGLPVDVAAPDAVRKEPRALLAAGNPPVDGPESDGPAQPPAVSEPGPAVDDAAPVLYDGDWPIHRINTPGVRQRLREAIEGRQPLAQITSGLAALGMSYQVTHLGRVRGVGSPLFVEVGLPDGTTARVEVRTGALPDGALDRLDTVRNPDGSVHARITVSNTLSGGALSTVLAHRIPGAAAFYAGLNAADDTAYVDPRAVPHTVEGSLERAELVSAVQAARLGDVDAMMRILDQAGLLGDEQGARQRLDRLWPRAAGMLEQAGLLGDEQGARGLDQPPSTGAAPGAPLHGADMQRRLFDTRPDGSEEATLNRLVKAVVSSGRFLSGEPHIFFDTVSRTITLIQDGQPVRLPIEIVPPGTREFAVRLSADDSGGLRLQVRRDASEVALLVELLGALGWVGYVESVQPMGSAMRVAQAAQVAALQEMHRRATSAERQFLRAYTAALRSPFGQVYFSSRQQIEEFESAPDPRGLKRSRRGRPLLPEGPQLRPKGPHFFRRGVSAAGSSANTILVALPFGRGASSVAVSVSSGVAGNVGGQAGADAVLGSALPDADLVWEVSEPPNLQDVTPPEPSRGDPIKSNLTKRLPYAAAAGLAAVVATILFGGKLLRSLKAGLITTAAALGQAFADKAADPHEFTAVGDRKAMAKLEPEHRRNQYAETVGHLVNQLPADLDSVGEADRQRLEALRAVLDQEIAHLDVELEGTTVDGVSVEGKLQALQRRRAEARTTLWNMTVGLVPGVARRERIDTPNLTYEMAHLPDAQAHKAVNPLRTGVQGLLMQLPSFILGVKNAPELLSANMAAGAGRGGGYGSGWTKLSAVQALDAEAVAATQSRAHLRAARDRIDAILQGRAPQVPPVPRSDAELHEREKAAGIPLEEDGFIQSRKHLIGLLGAVGGGVITFGFFGMFSPWLLTAWIGGQMLYTGAYIVGEGRMRVRPTLTKRLRRERQLAAAAAATTRTSAEILGTVEKMAEAIAAENERIAPVPTKEHVAKTLAGTLPEPSGNAKLRTADRAGIGAMRGLVDDDADGFGPGLRPGPNPTFGVRLTRADAVAVNRLVRVLRQFAEVNARIQAFPDVRLNAAEHPVVLEGYLRLRLRELGLVADQYGSAARWAAVVQDAARRHGLNPGEQQELARIRGGQPAEDGQPVQEWNSPPPSSGAVATEFTSADWVAHRMAEDRLRHDLIFAIDLLAADGTLYFDQADTGRRLHMRVLASGDVRVVTSAGWIDLALSTSTRLDDSALAVVRVPETQQLDAPYRIELRKEDISDVYQLAFVLTQIAEAHARGDLVPGGGFAIMPPVRAQW